MDYDDALGYMQRRLRLGEKLGLERLRALLDLLGNPQDALRVVHVAGTKGKGSTSAMAASILRAAGYKTGIYLSPYVYDVRERVQVNGEPISREDFARLVSRIKPHIEALEETPLGAVTEFELKTAVGMCHFAEQAVDYAVLEVGIGGRLDATNVIDKPLVTVITNIGLDHTEILGDTLGKIAAEKAGIVKPGVPCVTGVPIGGEADQVIARICAERGAPLIHVAERGSPGADAVYGVSDGGLDISTARRSLAELHLRLEGPFQHLNATLAAAALDAISDEGPQPISDDVFRAGLQGAYLPGRFERISDDPVVIVDAAHNEIAAQALAMALKEAFGTGENGLVLVVGMSRRHDPDTFLRPLAALRPVALFATEPSFRPLPAREVAVAAKRLDLPVAEIIPDGVADAVRAGLAVLPPGGVLCLTGSFYTVGDISPEQWRQLLSERIT